MRTILLIEDEESIGFMVRAVLSRRGYKTLYAAHAADARAIWTVYREEIELIITDNSLPDGSGVALAQEFYHEKSGLKVIVASGGIPEGLPDDFQTLEKPFDLASLLSAISLALGEN